MFGHLEDSVTGIDNSASGWRPPSWGDYKALEPRCGTLTGVKHAFHRRTAVG